MDKFVIRQGNEDYLKSVMTLQLKLAAEDIIYGFVPANKEELQSKLGPYFLVAELNGSVTGYCYGSVHESEGLVVIPKGEKYLEVDDVYIRPECRDQQVGGKLLDRLMEIAGMEGVARILIYSASNSKETDKVLQFYRRHGFKSWYVQMFK